MIIAELRSRADGVRVEGNNSVAHATGSHGQHAA